MLSNNVYYSEKSYLHLCKRPAVTGEAMGIRNQPIHEECINKQGTVGDKKPLKITEVKNFINLIKTFSFQRPKKFRGKNIQLALTY